MNAYNLLQGCYLFNVIIYNNNLKLSSKCTISKTLMNLYRQHAGICSTSIKFNIKISPNSIKRGK